MKPARLRFHLLSFLVMSWAAFTRAQFSGPYDLTPPSPSYYTFYGTTNFGDWTAEGLNQVAFYVFSTGAPASVELNTGHLSANNSCIFYTKAAAAGTVSFKYSITGISSGLFGWFDSGASAPSGYVPQTQYLGSVPDLISNATASFSVAAGDYFGFTLSIPQGMGVSDSHARDVIIDNFAAPRNTLTNNGNVGVIAGPITNSANNHQYYLLQASSWLDAEATAVSMGGHLTTLNDGAEHDWVMNEFSSFGGVDRKLWIGLYDSQPNVNVTTYPAWWQQFVWTSGQSATALYLRWPTPGINPVDGLYVYMLPPDQSSSYEPGEEVAADNTNMLNGVVEVPQPLQISSPPQTLSVGIGCTARMSVLADGTSPLSYQWQFMGSNLAGATSSILAITNVQPEQAGPYTVVVTNASGSLTSAPAVLTVTSVVLWDGPYTVPGSATNVVAISGGSGHALALRADGTVVAWGDNPYGQASVPAGLNAVEIAAGSFFSLALRADGSVVGWGSDSSGQIDIPAGLNSVVAMSGKGEHSLALKADGSLVAWGSNGSGQSNIPYGLGTALAIAAGGAHSLALKPNGTVVAWGDNSSGQTSVPANLTNVIAIAAGMYHSLALKADGSVVAWGNSSLTNVPAEARNIVAIDASYGQSLALKADGTVVTWGNFGPAVPPDLPNVVGIAAAHDFLLALVGDATPHVCFQPHDLAAQTGETVNLCAKCVGLQPMVYQWRLNGVDIAGATTDTYSITSAQLADAGSYALVASNALGVATTRGARLGVYVATNRPPQFGPQTDRTINARSQLVVTNTATDPDLGEHLTYQLVTSPAGATIDSTGVIRWTPSSVDAPGANVFTTVVTDDGVPPLSATNSFTIVLLDSSHTGPVGIMAGPFTCPANHHQYYLLNPASWTDAEATAVAMGGHLVTFRNQDEEQWLIGTFLGSCEVGQALWIGLSDPTPWLPNDNSWAWCQHFLWADGEPVTFFCWSANPTITSQGVGRIKWVHLASDPCAWAEEADSVSLNAIVEIPLPLEIITQPQNLSVGIGRDASLSVVADGTSPITYQWQFMGTNLPGATTSTLVLKNARPSQSGPYDVIVSNTEGTLVSATALLAVQGLVGWGNPHSGILDFPASATNIVAISCGSAHSLALRADGSVVVWGDDSLGQTDVPTDLTNVVSIAAGDWHSLALTASGTVIAWGSNSYGQTNVPSGLSNVVAISAGSTHSLALKADGTLVGWGQQPLIPDGVTNVAAIAAGAFFDLALKTDGTLVTWGNYGQSAAGTWIKSYIPDGLTNVVAIAAASGHCLALRSDATVASWGTGFFGEALAPSGLGNVVAISAGDNASLALKADGTVVAWGLTNFVIPQPADLHDIVAIAAGGDFNLALLRDDAAHSTNATPVGVVAGPIVNPANGHKYYLLQPATWTNAELAAVALGGHLVTLNNSNENTWVYTTFGNYNGVSRDIWIGLYDPDPSVRFANPITQVAKYTWTSGQPVQLAPSMWAEGGPFNHDHISSGIFKLCGPGNPNVPDRGLWADDSPSALLYSVVELPSDLEIVAQPQSTTIGIGCDANVPVFADGTTPISYQWQLAGTNLPGQSFSKLILTNIQFSQSGSYSVIITNTSGMLLSLPAQISVVSIVTWGSFLAGGDPRTNVPPDLTNVVAIAAGYYHDLALRAEGTVAAWGQDVFNQVDVPTGLSNVVAIAGGSSHSLALKADGTVVAWGSTLGTTTQVPSDLTNVVAIDAGDRNSLALKADGTVVAWGEAYGGVSIAPQGLTNAVAISAGAGHDLALLADGTVIDWNDATGALNATPSDLTNAVAISAGLLSSLALKADGTVVSWGTGIDYGGSRNIPAGLSNAVAISIKWDHSLAMTDNGTLVAAWGTNFSGESSVPARLPNVVAIAGGYYHSLALLRGGAPNVTVQPWDRSVAQGSTPAFAAKAVSRDAMGYQWQFNGQDIAGATEDSLSIPNAGPTNAGTYEVSISNKLGTVVSRHAKLVVSTTAPPSNTNQPPVLPGQSDRTIDELSTLLVVNTATDTSVPPSALSYQLLNPPLGATIDSTGIIRWTPTDVQAPGTAVITTVVSDGGTPSLSATNSFTVIVNQINTPPTLPVQPQRMISALSQLIVTNAAFNPVAASGLSYQLVNPPGGALIDQAGVIRWTPTRAQGPSTNTLTTVVTLASIPRIADTNAFTVIVSAPMLQASPDYAVNVGQTVNFTNLASDNDPARKLAFTLELAPTGASITSDTGVFNWRPPVTAAGTTNRVLVRVTDDSPVPLNDSRAFTITVNALQPVALIPMDFTNGQFQFHITGPVGPDYILQATTGLTNWSDIRTSSPVLMPFDFSDPTANSTTNRFYRIRLGPL